MAPEIQGVVRSAQAWLQSSWQVQVPFAWLRACVEWLQEEGGGGAPLTQQQINQQVLDQWLLTDLRDLGHPVLPVGLSQAQKTELCGTFCVQVDSLLDISLPAYGQLQKWKGTDCANEVVSAVTQTTQRPWEAKPTRMLLLQVTDGVQSLEAMECQPIPVLNTALRPGVKLQLQGQMVCRLGMLLLGPANVKLLGGEVEDMVDRNNQGRMLCRALGLSEEQQDGAEQQHQLPAPQQRNEEAEDLDLDDQELLASIEAQEQVEQVGGWRAEGGPSLESGYGTLSQTSTRSYRTASVRSEASTASSRSDASNSSYRSGSIQSNRSGSVQGRHGGNQQDDSTLVTSSSTSFPRHEVMDHNMGDEDFPDEDFDDLPLDELDIVIFQESTNGAPQSNMSHRNAPQTNNRLAAQPNSSNRKPQTTQLYRTPQQQHINGTGPRLSTGESRITRQHNERSNPSLGRGQLEAVTSAPHSASASLPPHGPRGGSHYLTNDEIMDEDIDSFFPEEMETSIGEPRLESTRNITQGIGQNSRAEEIDRLSGHRIPTMGSTWHRSQGPGQSKIVTERAAIKIEPADSGDGLMAQPSRIGPARLSFNSEPGDESSRNTPQGISCTSRATVPDNVSVKNECDSTAVPTLTLTSLPFTYLCLLQDRSSEPHRHTQEIRVKAFIVTLLGKLTSKDGEWRIGATITDGTGYLDVALSDAVLTGLLGFSVAEKGVLKRDAARRGELDAGMKRCQEELVDMCCVMTIRVEPQGDKAVVTSADPVTEEDILALEERMKERRK